MSLQASSQRSVETDQINQRHIKLQLSYFMQTYSDIMFLNNHNSSFYELQNTFTIILYSTGDGE